jgi:hypothetical protein
VREIVSPLLDNAPPQPNVGGLRERLRTLGTMMEVGVASARHRDVLVPFYELFTGKAEPAFAQACLLPLSWVVLIAVVGVHERAVPL